jgi:DNA-binding transcriptional MerR regulator
MAVEINGQTYFRTADICRIVGISRSTLFRWLKKGILDQSYRDRKNWRLFTEDDLHRIETEANRMQLGEKP